MKRTLRMAGLISATVVVVALLASFYVAVFVGYRTMLLGAEAHCPAPQPSQSEASAA